MFSPLVLFSAFALAAPPTYRWTPGEVVRYYLDTEIYWPGGVKAVARENVDSRMTDLKLRAEAECTVAARGKNTELECRLPWLELKADPQDDSQARIDKVMADWVEFTEPAVLILRLGPDGRVKDFDMNGLEHNNIKEGRLNEQMRTFLRALFAPLDVGLTTDDKDWVRGWVRKDLGLATQLPVFDGTVGAGTVTYIHAGDRLGLALISMEGRATVTSGAGAETSANGALVDLRVGGETWVDPVAGQILFSGFSSDGRKTASSSTGSNDQFVAQRSGIQRVPAFSADHAPPLSVIAQRAPLLGGATPAPVEGLPLVDFSTLGMDPLFVTGFPDIAVIYELPTSKVKSRVEVGSDGAPTSSRAYAGYEVLAEHVERALKGAKFPAKGSAYAVDVEVEVRAR